MRRTKPYLIYKKTKNLRVIQLLLGHKKLESTVRYLGIEVDDALEISESIEVWPVRAASAALRDTTCSAFSFFNKKYDEDPLKQLSESCFRIPNRGDCLTVSGWRNTIMTRKGTSERLLRLKVVFLSNVSNSFVSANKLRCSRLHFFISD